LLRKSPLYEVLRVNVVGFLRSALRMEGADEEEVLRVCGVMDTNAFEVRRAGGVRLRALYPLAALMNHDCVPNTRHVFDASDKMLVFATVAIAKGAPVVATYTQALWSTPRRRAHLRATKCFDCACLRCRVSPFFYLFEPDAFPLLSLSRCSDPSELGTYVSAIRCSKCGEGRVVATAPLDDAAAWRCDACAHQMTSKQISWGNQALQQELEQLDKRGPHHLEAFLERYDKLLLPSNGHALQAKLALTQIYGNTQGFLLQVLTCDFEVVQTLNDGGNLIIWDGSWYL
jgi:hypothetical protein